MKRTLTALTLLLTLSLFACAHAVHYRRALPLDTLCTVALDALGGEDYLIDTAGVTEDYFPMPDCVTEHVILYCRDVDCIDEIGFFRTSERDAEALAELLRSSYLAPAYEKNRDFYDSYIPRETPKLRDARVECFGDTVVYAILSPTDQATLFSALRDALREG